MIDFLLGVPGKLSTIIGWFNNYWTAARAAKIDYLDAAISSRAQASTAVSNADYTPTRAALLDGIIQNSVINSIQIGYNNNAGQWGTGTGEDIRYVDTTITAVNPSKSIVLVWGAVKDSTTGNVTTPTARLTSSTNVRMAFGYNSGNPVVIFGRFTVIEFK
jgi:hypothetical protein